VSLIETFQYEIWIRPDPRSDPDTYRHWRNQELGGPWTKMRAPLLTFPPIPVKGLPPEIFTLVHEFYCTLNIKFSTVMQWVLWISLDISGLVFG